MEDETKQCSFCGKEIHINAKKCRFCNNWLNDKENKIENEKICEKDEDEIECPFCAEKIKSYAKKCRFCGEWIAKDNITNKLNPLNQHDTKTNLENKHKKNLIILSTILALLAIIFLFVILILYLYVPSCGNKTIVDKLYKHLIAKNPEITDLVLDRKSAAIISKSQKGYSCSIDAIVDSAPIHFEYEYQKVSFNDFNFNVKPVLPDCYSSMVKTLLKNLIKDSTVYNIKEIASDISTENETVDIYDKGKPCYNCKAQATITSKPGTAFNLGGWNANAERKIKCGVDYKTYFCSNGFATCVSLSDVYSCEYEKGE